MLDCGDAAGGSEDDDDDVVIVGVSTASDRLAAAKAAVGSLCIVVFLPAQPQPIDSRFAAATSCWYSELHHAWLHLYAVAPFRLLILLLQAVDLSVENPWDPKATSDDNDLITGTGL